MLRQPRRRSLTIAIVLFAFAFTTSCSAEPNDEPGPFTRVTLIAGTADGKPPSGDQMETAREILADRVASAGFDKPEVVLSGDSQIVISVRGRHTSNEFAALVRPAQVRFRKILGRTDGTSSGAANPASPDTAIPPSRTAVLAKLGPAAAAAATLSAPNQDAALSAVLQPFGNLTPAEVGVLETRTQFNVPQIGCATLNLRPVGSIQDITQSVVACEGQSKYLLDVAKVSGTDIASASPKRDQQTGHWVIELKFSAAGTNKWTDLTREAFNNSGDPKCGQEALGDQQHCLVAIVLDNTVISAPEIQGVLTDQAQISGSFDEKSAKILANQMSAGSLPVTFQIQDVAIVDPLPTTSH